MGITLLTLSRQHAAGKIATEDYRAQRRRLIEEQVFQLEERTMPGFAKEPDRVTTAVMGDMTQPQPVAHMAPASVPGTPTDTFQGSGFHPQPKPQTSGDVTTLNTRSRLGELAHPEKASDKQPGSGKKGLWLGLVIGFIIILVVSSLYLFLGNQERSPEPVDDPLKTATTLLLENPDWQIKDLQAYREQLNAQTDRLSDEQVRLLDSVETYLSVPLNGEASALEQEVQRLRQDLEALRK